MTSKSGIKYLPPLTTLDQGYRQLVEDQHPIHNTNNAFLNAIILKKKNNAIFLDSIPRDMKMKQLTSQLNEGRTNLKDFPGAKQSQ